MEENSKVKANDPNWDHCEKVDEEKNRRLKLKCLHCLNSYWGCISRMKNHLARNHKEVAPCTKCSKEVTKFLKNLLSDRKIEVDVHVKDKDDIQVVEARKDKIVAS